MKCILVLAAVAACASAGLIAAPLASTLVRAPAFDSAVIKSDRLGGNFAYSTAENHAYAAVSPVVQHVATPVAVSYSAPAVVAAPSYYVPQPAFAHFAHAPVVAHAPAVVAPASPFVVAAAPVEAPAAPAPAEDAAPAESAPAPVAAEAPAPEAAPAAPASDDTVSVEAA